MPRPAFLVEGDLEKKAIQKLCPNLPVQKIVINGRDVAIEAIARRIDTQARLLGKRYRPIVILFDREGRTESCSALRDKLYELLGTSREAGSVVIGVPDRCIENWILADWRSLCERYQIRNVEERNYEGQNGKAALRVRLETHADRARRRVRSMTEAA